MKTTDSTKEATLMSSTININQNELPNPNLEKQEIISILESEERKLLNYSMP
jgi:hypothetical protein